jgi:hypothetical protein
VCGKGKFRGKKKLPYFLSHIKRRSNDDRFLPLNGSSFSDLKNNSLGNLVIFFTKTLAAGRSGEDDYKKKITKTWAAGRSGEDDYKAPTTRKRQESREFYYQNGALR